MMASIHLRRVGVFIYGLVSITTAALSVNSAAAQSTAPGSAPVEETSTALAEIVVTARKREERLIDVPVAVTEVNAQALKEVPDVSLTQIGNLVPGVSLERTGGGTGGAAFTIRGVGQLAADYNSEQPVALNIDGVQITRGPVAAIGFFDLESVEVLKGPQALFFGKNSPAGVVSVQSVTPGDKLEGYVRAGYEFSASTPSFDGAVSIPLTDTLSVRFAGHYSHDNSGYIENTARPTANPFDGPTEPLPGAANTEGPLDRDGIGRVTVAWRPEGNFDATLKVLGSYHHDWNSNTAENISCGANAHPTDVNPLTGQAVQDPFGDCSANHQISVGNGPAGIVNTFAGGPADGQPFTEARAWVSSLQMHYQFADKLDLTSITGYYHNNYAAFGNFDGTVFAQALDAENIVNTQMSEELRLASNFDSPVNFTVGTYYEHQKQETTNTDKVAPLPPYPIPGPYFGASNTVAMEAANKADSYSAFGQVSWKILENLELAGGARYTHDERSASVQSVLNYFDLLAPAFGIPNPFSSVGVVLTPKINENNVSPEATLTYHPIKDVTLYGAFKTGYLAGAIGNPANVPNFTALADPSSGLIYKPEKVKGGELGAKGLFLDDRLRADLTVFRYDYTDLQVSTYHPDSNAFFPGNAGKARNTGVELQSAYRLTRNFTISASASYINLKFIQYTGAQCYPGQTPEEGCAASTNSQDLSGTHFGDGPFNVKFGGSYEHAITGNLSASLDASVYHVSRSPNYERDVLAVDPAYTLVNAGLRVFEPNGPWEVSVIGTNLNNGIYVKNFIFKPLGAVDDVAAQTVSIPRQVTLRVGYSF
jgi:outer membrane receptor protein involved in Fe transport